ncbi:malonyl-CoA decarboxylase [bacterium]|nr:malonyl-CoA decarboxylase [bacterium]
MVAALKNKTVIGMLRAWQNAASSARYAMFGTLTPDLKRDDAERIVKLMASCLDGKGGEVASRARTIELGEMYLRLSDKGRTRFLTLLAERFDVPHAKVSEWCKRYLDATEDATRAELETSLREMLISGRIRILRQFSGLPNGMKFLVDLRNDLVPLTKESPQCKSLETELKLLLASWFDVDLLDMVQIDWRSPAAILEKLIEYEAVHKIESWADLKNRLDSDRRCFAFFHHKMPDEPLIFIEVALEKGIPDNVQTLLDESKPVGNPKEADTAVFYSISNTQKGLNGISFGNFLIKRVVAKLSSEFKNLKHFVTLSPVPGFMAWLASDAPKPKPEDILAPAALRRLGKDAWKTLQAMLAEPGQREKGQEEWLQQALTSLCAYYLCEAKNKKGYALDPVAHFHLSNGARLERINCLADVSAKGFKQAAGIMVNYYYDLDEIDDCHEAYFEKQKVTASRQVKTYLKK